MRSITLTGSGNRTGSSSANAMGLAEFYGLALADPANRRTWWPDGGFTRQEIPPGTTIKDTRNPLASIRV